MDNKDTIVARVRQFAHHEGLSQAALARRLGIDPANLSKVLNGQLPLSRAFINRMVVEGGVSKDWLLSGNGTMYPQAGLVPAVKGAPVFDVDITAGPFPSAELFAREHAVGWIDLPNVNPTTMVVSVSGDSMEPEVMNGALVAIRPVSPNPPFFWGHMYVVVLDEYRMLKYLRRNPDDAGSVILHSCNTFYDDMIVPVDEIRRLFIVETVINIKRLS